MEYWIVYDVATGMPLYPGSGQPGTAACQPVEEGCRLILVPYLAWRSAMTAAWPDFDLTSFRTAMDACVDAEAEAARARYLTPGSGQAITYTRKEDEARAWTVDPSIPTPFLSAEAQALGITVDVLASEVIARADAWITVGAAIEGKRMGAKAAIAAAQTFGAIVNAREVVWSAIIAPPGA